MQSPLPLAVKDSSGALAGTDLALEKQAGAWRPRRAPESIRFGEHAPAGITLESAGVSLRPAFAAPATGTATGDGVFYGNVARDTDLMSAASPGGAQFALQLRSPASPSSFDFTLSLPAGARLEARHDPAPQVRVVRGVDDVLLTLSPPAAFDAQGAPVSVDYDVQGNVVTLKVDHRAGDFAYPIAVDPSVTDSFNWETGGETNYSNWFTRDANTSHHYAQGNLGWGAGLNIYNDPHINYPYGTFGMYYFPARGDSFITEADLSNLTFWDMNANNACAQAGIGIPWTGWDGTEWVACTGGEYAPTVYGNGTPGNFAAVALSNSGATGAYNDLVQLGTIVLHYGDNHAPSIVPDPATNPSGWINGNSTRAVALIPSDAGLGIKSYGLLVPQTSGTPLDVRPAPYACSSHVSFCYQNTPNPHPSVNVDFSKVPEGDVTFKAFAVDAVGNPTSGTTNAPDYGPQTGTNAGQNVWHVKVDRTNPTVDTSGELDQAEDEPRVVTDSANLDVNATDESDSGAATSGVQTIKVQIDGADPSAAHPYAPTNANIYTRQASCDGCSLQHDFPIDMSTFVDGPHTVDLYVTDYAGNTAHEQWTVTVDRTSARPFCSERSADPSGCQPDPPSTVAPSCAPVPPLPGAPAGSTITTGAAVTQTQQTDPADLASSVSSTIESLPVAPALTTDPLSYQSSATLLPSTLGATAPTYTVGSGSASGCVAPASLTTSPSPPQLVNGVAVEYSNTAPSTDTILRPTPLGVQEVQQIRDSTAPQVTSYQVTLAPGQRLQLLDSGSVAVIDPTLPTSSGAVPPTTDGVSNAPNAASAEESIPGAATDTSGQIAYTPQDLAGLTPDDADIAASATQSQYESEDRLLGYADQDADGQEVMVISPPYARDSAGTVIPSTIAVTGPNTFSITTSHAESPRTYPVYVSHKTMATTSRRKHTAIFGWSGGGALDLSANDANGQGTTKVRNRLSMPRRTTSSLKDPPTARYVMYYENSCDRYDSGPTPQDIRTVPEPPAGTAAHSDWSRCRRGSDFIKQAEDEHLAPYITFEPSPEATSFQRGPDAYAQSIARLWHYSNYQDVKFWGPVNEPDFGSSSKMPASYAANIWRHVETVRRAQCTSCRLVAGEFSRDVGANDGYVGGYMSFLKGKHADPHVWALHDYYDVIFNDTARFEPKSSSNPSKQYAQARYFASRVRAYNKRDRVWLSEQGVLLTGKGAPLANGGKAAQRKAAQRFKALAVQDRSIDLVNYYEFFGCFQQINCRGNFDSALVRDPPDPPPNSQDGPGPVYTFGGFRAAYCVLTKQADSLCYQGAGQ